MKDINIQYIEYIEDLILPVASFKAKVLNLIKGLLTHGNKLTVIKLMSQIDNVFRAWATAFIMTSRFTLVEVSGEDYKHCNT